MSEEYKQKLQGLRAVHFFGARWHREVGKSGVRPAMTEQQLAETPPVTHPLIRTHPETGRKAVYAGGFAVGIEGWDKLAAEQLLDEINSFSTQQQFIFTHKWKSGDIVFWDNRCTMHCVTTYDAAKERRVVHRAVVQGDRPY